MQHVVALRSDAVDVVAHFGETAVFVGAGFVFHEFLEAVSGQLFVFYVGAFVFFCEKNTKLDRW